MTGRNPPPVLELAEHDLDRVVTFVPALVVPYGRLPFLPARAAWAYLIVVQGLPEPVGIVATISEQPLHVGQPAEQRSRLNVVAEGAGGQEQIDGAALAIANGVQLRVPFSGETVPRTVYYSLKPFGSANQASTPPFLTPKLDAVRWAFRGVALTITVVSS